MSHSRALATGYVNSSWNLSRPAATPLQPGELVLAVNRYLAGRLGLDPRYTISSNIALAISRSTGMAVSTAKRLFHGGVAGFVAAMLHLFGAGIAAVIGTGVLCWQWLESFDNSAYQR